MNHPIPLKESHRIDAIDFGHWGPRVRVVWGFTLDQIQGFKSIAIATSLRTTSTGLPQGGLLRVCFPQSTGQSGPKSTEIEVSKNHRLLHLTPLSWKLGPGTNQHSSSMESSPVELEPLGCLKLRTATRR